MSLIVLAIVGAAAGASAAMARLVYARRARAKAHGAARPDGAAHAAGAGATPAARPDGGERVGLLARALAGFAVQPADVVQVDDETRWLGPPVVAGDTLGVRCALFATPEEGPGKLVAAFAPPSRHLYWLDERTVDLPPAAPTTIECAGAILERASSHPVALQASDGAPELGSQGTLALYAAPSGEVALLLRTERGARFWLGRRLEPEDYDVVGNAPRDEA